MSTIEIVTLAGGTGSRMGNLTKDCQKCLLTIEEKPILSHLIDKLLEAFGSIDLKVESVIKLHKLLISLIGINQKM